MPSRRLPFWIFKYLTQTQRHLPDLSWITPSLSVSGTIKIAHYRSLANLGISAVVDLRYEGKDDQRLLAMAGIDLLHLPTKDRCSPSNLQLETGVIWISKHLEQGNKVLVHCKNGIGRSFIMAACALVCQGNELEASLRLIKNRRWGAYLNHRQHSALNQFIQTLTEKHSQ